MEYLKSRLLNLKLNVILEIHKETGSLDFPPTIKPDLKYFKHMTTLSNKGNTIKNAVIMGRKTYETIGHPLPNRHNYIISKTLTDVPGCNVDDSLDKGILSAMKNPDVDTIWICGGKQIYEQFLSRYSPHQIYVVYNLQKYEGECMTVMDIKKLIPDSKYYIGDINEKKNYTIYNLRKPPPSEEYNYIKLVRGIIENGFYQLDRTKVGTYTQHGAMLRFNLRNNTLPVVTSRRAFFRGAVEEFLWMLRGETNITPLKEKGIHIWDGNTTAEFIKNRGLEEIVPTGDIGALYGFQIRNYNGDWDAWKENKKRTGIDQLKNLIENLKRDPESRRHVISNYNPCQLLLGTLEPCHMLYAFNIDENKRELHSTLFMRSTDTCCGMVLNIIHISLLTHLLAKVISTDDATYSAGDCVYMGNNVHIYTNHLHEFMLQSYRQRYKFPTISINKNISSVEDIEQLNYENDIEILDYRCGGTLRFEMAV